MAKKLGRPRQNMTRSLTRREKEILSLVKLRSALIEGTADGFNVYNAVTGCLVNVGDAEKSRLIDFWEQSHRWVWGQTVTSSDRVRV